jgi:hypothetical protein
MLDDLYASLDFDEAVVLMIKKDCTIICKRKKGHGDQVLKKFINFGFCPLGHACRKGQSLSLAIRTIADNLPEYCYEAILGDEKALRKTTEHLLKVYKKKAERMRKKKKKAQDIAQVLARHDEIQRYLELSDVDLAASIDTLIIEVPKNPKVFEELDELVAIGAE